MNKIFSPTHTAMLVFLLGFLTINTATAQNNTRSPYSMYGIGEMQSQVNIATSGMGNAGIAMQSGKYINMLNPASYQGIDSLEVIFDTGVDGKFSRFKSSGDTEDHFNGNYSYMALAFRISPSFAMGLGLNPYSSTGYEVNSSLEVIGTNIEYPLDVIGTGDISRAYLAASYAPIKNLSLGVKTSFLFGKMSQTQYHNLSYLGSYSVYNLTTDYFYNFYFELGLQYQFNIKNTTIGLGAIYTPKQDMVTHRETATYNEAGVVYDEDTESEHSYPIPSDFGFGLTLNNNKNMIFAIDGGMQMWGDYSYDVSEVDYANSAYVNTGLEYTPSKNFLAPFFHRVNYRFGFRYKEDYLQLRGNQLKDAAVSIGFGFPISKGASRIDLSIEGGRYGTQDAGLIQENYCRIRLGFSMHDRWFQTRKFN